MGRTQMNGDLPAPLPSLEGYSTDDPAWHAHEVRATAINSALPTRKVERALADRIETAARRELARRHRHEYHVIIDEMRAAANLPPRKPKGWNLRSVTAQAEVDERDELLIGEEKLRQQQECNHSAHQPVKRPYGMFCGKCDKKLN